MVKLLEKRNHDAKFNAAGFVFFIQVVHVGLVFAILKKLYLFEYFRFSVSYYENKMYMFPFALVALILVYIFFKRRHNKIQKKYSNKKLQTTWNTIIVFSLMFLPLLLMIYLLKK